MKFWIKERINPQTGTYYMLCGRLSNTEASRGMIPLYGENIMHPYDSMEEYNNAIEKLQTEGCKVLP